MELVEPDNRTSVGGVEVSVDHYIDGRRVDVHVATHSDLVHPVVGRERICIPVSEASGRRRLVPAFPHTPLVGLLF